MHGVLDLVGRPLPAGRGLLVAGRAGLGGGAGERASTAR